ncbi:MAG: glycine cleavage system protein GcvH [Gammaproteobacteria bacterium]|nr:glycine cleavage system protein GcvH [Gammaproteobacteria bacterium]
MSHIPEELRYNDSHEWVRQEEDGTVTVGITDHAQAQLGDLVYVELPEPGASLQANESLGVVESVKAASDIFSPIGGRVVAVNTALADAPEQVNADPYGDGWLVRLAPEDPGEIGALLDSEGYQAVLDSENE